MSQNIWAGDRLQRQAEAHLLTVDLLHRNILAVKRNSGSVSTNVDASWGTGKTFFIKRFQAQVEKDGFTTVYIDAWKEDYSDDPLHAVMSPILAAVATKSVAKKVTKKLKGAAGSILYRAGKGLLVTGATKIFGKDGTESIVEEIGKVFTDATVAKAGEVADEALAQYKKSKENIETFKVQFAEAILSLPHLPLFVFIDELDRCRPTYAIRLLERVKHLFDMPNIAFVFSTNTDELYHTICSVYGENFDAKTYLRRFFDRTYHLETPSHLEFIKNLWDEYQLPNERFISPPPYENTVFVKECAEAFDLSLRDLQQCHEILFTVEKNSNPKIKIPLGFVFVLIILFHRHYLEAFDSAKSATGSWITFVPDQIRAKIGRTSIRTKVSGQNISIYEIFNRFNKFAHDSLHEHINENSAVGQMVEAYRVEEYLQLRSSVAEKSTLVNYFNAISRAAKLQG